MPTEYTEVEKPVIEALKTLGYRYSPPDEAAAERDGLNNVLLNDTLWFRTDT